MWRMKINEYSNIVFVQVYYVILMYFGFYVHWFAKEYSRSYFFEMSNATAVFCWRRCNAMNLYFFGISNDNDTALIFWVYKGYDCTSRRLISKIHLSINDCDPQHSINKFRSMELQQSQQKTRSWRFKRFANKYILFIISCALQLTKLLFM